MIGFPLELAAREHDIDLENSWMVGDKYSDIGAISRVGGNGILVLTGAGHKERQRHRDDASLPQPSAVCDDILKAAQYILGI